MQDPGVHRETARYWYKKKLLAKGFAVQAAVAYERLGLKYVVMVVDFEDDFEEYVKPILRAMSEFCYVRYYNRTLPKGDYIVHAIVPEGRVRTTRSLFEGLRERGISGPSRYSWPIGTEMFRCERSSSTSTTGCGTLIGRT